MSERLRVCQIMLGRGFGGAERYFVDLCTALAGRGHAVLAIAHPRFAARASLKGQPGIEYVPVRSRGPWDLWAAVRIGRALRRFQPQLVQTHLARAARLGGFAARRAGVPVLAKLHNAVDLKHYRRVDRFIATSPAQAEYLSAHGVAAARVAVIPNFSRLPAVAEAHRPAPEPVFAAYGRFVPAKGFEVLLAACAQLRAQGRAFRLRLGGDGPLRTALLAQARRLALTHDRFEYAGWVTQPERLLAAADVCVLPSLDEPFGIVLLEAMAAGRPIVATRTQGPLAILDETSALLVAPGDADALAQALAAVQDDPTAAQRRAARALEIYRQRYSEAAVLPRLLALYRDLLGDASPAAAGTRGALLQR